MPRPVLREFELLVMLAVLQLGEDAYPLAVAERIEQRTGRKASRPAVLITLERLEDKGLITSRFGDPTPVRGGRSKRVFSPRPLALKALRDSLGRIEAMTTGLESLFETAMTGPAATPTRPPVPSKLSVRCLRAVTSAARAEAIVGDVVEDVMRRSEALARPRLSVEAAAWRHVAAEAFEHLPVSARSARLVMRDAWRGLRFTPATTALAFAILSVGIAAATVTFSVVDNVLLRPLPYADPDRLARVELKVDLLQPFGNLSPLPVFLYERLRDDSTVFTSLAAVTGGTFALGTDAPEAIAGVTATASLFDVLGVRPALGQAFTAAKEAAGADAVALIGHDLWRRRFGGDPSIVGRSIVIGDRSVVVIGVMSSGFAYPIDQDRRAEIWMPFVAPEDERSGVQLGRYLSVVGRLKQGTSLSVAEDRANAILSAIVPPGPGRLDGTRAVVRSLIDTLFAPVRGWMLLVLGAVVLVMLIACANVANLLLSRATGRARELAIRASLGASRRRLILSLLSESLMLSMSAAALGLIVALWAVGAARATLPAGIARASSVALDLRILAAAAIAAVVTGLLIGVVPAWLVGRRDLATLLRNQSASVTTGRARWRSSFLVAQVAFVGLLLVATTLFVTSFVRVTQSDLGFERRNLVAADLNGITGPIMDVVRAVAEVPGVAFAGVFQFGSAPLARAGGFGGGATGTTLRRPDAPLERNSADVLFLRITPGYFAAAGIPIVRGRDFTVDDVGRDDRVVIDANVERRLYPEGDSIGSKVLWGEAPATIVGVVAVVRDRGPENDPNPALYVASRSLARAFGLLIRTTSSPAAVIPSVRTAIDRFRRPGSQPIVARPLEEAFRVITADRRFAAGLMSLFGVFALIVGAAGIYGVMTSVVAQQTREFGIRVALGAHARTILLGVVTRAARHLALGLAIGLAAGFLAARGIESNLFGVAATDVTIYLTVTAVTLVVGLLAAIIPARRAARVDPLVSLRSE